MPKGADARLARAACFAAALFTTVAAHADTRTLYRWTDGEGRTQYSDKPPTGFKGEVTRVEVDLDTNTRPAALARPPAIPADVMRDVTPPDMAKTRRDRREKLEAVVKQAQQKVAVAKAALDGGGDPKEDERQVIQRRFAKAQAGMSNCRVSGEGGKTPVVCPAMIPNDQYYERVRGQEEALRKAEEELAEAETAYRRGVD
ncbi:MAG: DUF4124 domain-containing protein [Burkholderiales bacterium]|nr:DUF4124 domain-containing protein [Burkholderiales bacterium]